MVSNSLGFTNCAGIQKQAPALAVFAAQLWLNFQWPLLFFKEKKIVSRCPRIRIIANAAFRA
jgi:tryptophan-rich sensory protein